jgi:hypothetical protein
MNCPSCGERITWFQKWRFQKGICSRKASACPYCGLLLIWAKWPHRLATSGSLLLILGVCSNYFFPDKTVFGFDFGSLCLLAALPLMILGLCGMKFDAAGESTP